MNLEFKIHLVPFVLCSALIATHPATAQLQTSNWVIWGDTKLIDVAAHPPQVIGEVYPPITDSHIGTISDEDGNLLFYTNGSIFLNKDNQIIGQSGNKISGQANICIVPYPGKDKVYNVFFADFDYPKYTVYHSIVDLTKTDDVASPSQIIANNLLSSYGSSHLNAVRAVNSSDPNSYWLIFPDGENMRAYYVNQNGINTSPVISSLGASIKKSRIAPDGKTFAFTSTNDTEIRLGEFDASTGKFYFRFKGGSDLQEPYFFGFYNNLEFSPDSQNLFVVSTPGNLIPVVCVYKTRVTTPEGFTNSKLLLYSFQSGLLPGLQLTPSGKIYIINTSNNVSGATYLSSIGNPNATTIEGFNFEPFTFSRVGYIENSVMFPAYYFQEVCPVTFNLKMGSDTILCRNQDIVLGGTAQGNYTYTWTSTGNLSATNIASPVLIAPNNSSLVYDTIVNYVVAEGECERGYDTIRVIYKPAYEAKIQGGKSVCPGVTEVAYSLEGNVPESGDITWYVTGGTILGDFNNSITVDWGATNFSSLVRATSINAYGCTDFIDPFPVKVFKSLDTEKPFGSDTLACNTDSFSYKIQGTNGSVYAWQVINGLINQGNGTNQVSINWDPTQKYGSVWINESVNTDLETCFGTSDTLQIVNPKAFGNENVHLYGISSDLDNASRVTIYYNIQNQGFFNLLTEVFWKPKESVHWSTPIIIQNNQNSYVHEFEKDIDGEHEFQLVSHNICNIEVKSRINTNIFLSLEKDLQAETLILNWNKPAAWNIVNSYQLYKLKDEEEFTLYDQMPGITAQNVIINTLDGFHFEYYIIGYSDTDSPVPITSNKINVSFEHVPFIPNIITPNGDGQNDYLVIDKLNLYPNNHLIIYNRNGNKVFEQTDYQNSWNGSGLPMGVYYYVLRTNRNSKVLKGWLQILH